MNKPISVQNALRLSLLFLVVISIAAGYYQLRWQDAEKRYARLLADYQELQAEIETTE